MKNKILIAFLCVTNFMFSQNYLLNKIWENTGSDSVGIYDYISSTLDANSNLIFLSNKKMSAIMLIFILGVLQTVE